MALTSSLGSKIPTALQFVLPSSLVYIDGNVGVGEIVFHDLGKSQVGVWPQDDRTATAALIQWEIKIMGSIRELTATFKHEIYPSCV